MIAAQRCPRVLALAIIFAIIFAMPGARATCAGEIAPFVAIDAGDAALVARGKSVYGKECASCHGVNLEGQPDWRRPGPNGRLPAPPHDDRGHTWHHDDATLFGIAKLGTAEFTGLDIESDMPAFSDFLSDGDIRAALGYIKSRWSPRAQRLQSQINARARAATQK